MLIEIDFNSDEALYVQLQNQIIMGIAMDIIREGDALPSVRQMADTVGINMHTVNKAYTILKQEGLSSWTGGRERSLPLMWIRPGRFWR